MYVYRVYVFACAMFAGLATDTSMDGTEDVFEFMHELCHLLQNSKKSGWEVGILGISWDKNWRFASASHCCHVQLLVVSCDAQDCARLTTQLNLKWIAFCWSRPAKCLPLDEGSACVRNGRILHNDYFDFIYDWLATREKKKIDGGSPLLACPDGSSLFETAPFQAPLEFHPRPMSPMSLQ